MLIISWLYWLGIQSSDVNIQQKHSTIFVYFLKIPYYLPYT